jgi:hypothetical protein
MVFTGGTVGDGGSGVGVSVGGTGVEDGGIVGVGGMEVAVEVAGIIVVGVLQPDRVIRKSVIRMVFISLLFILFFQSSF